MTLPLPTQGNLIGWGLSTVVSLILLTALSCVSLHASSTFDLTSDVSIKWWGVFAFVAFLFGTSLWNYLYVRQLIDLVVLEETVSLREQIRGQ